MLLGGVAWRLVGGLFLRGLRTLDFRLERSVASAEKIIGFFETRQERERIYYPFYPGNPQYELARRQMKRGGGLFTVALRVNSSGEVEKFCNALRRFLLEVSWGGYESLILPRWLGLEAGSAEEIGRALCRERECQYVSVWVSAVPL